MSLARIFAAARAGFARWRHRHRAYAELMALDDRMLADIGLTRSEIRAVAWGPSGGEEEFGEDSEERCNVNCAVRHVAAGSARVF